MTAWGNPSINACDAEAHRPALPSRVRSISAILSFFALAFALSWTTGYAAAQAKPDYPFLSIALAMVSGFGPSLAALAVVAAFSEGNGLRNWLARCLNWRVGWRWHVFAFLAPPAVMLSALGIHILLGGGVPAPMPAAHMPLVIANFGLVFLVGGPLGEEFGWRGYAMPALTAKMNWRMASLIIGVIWGLWHLPLFFMVSTPQSSMPIPMFMLNIAAGSVLFGWLFEQTQGSILPALLLHTSLNSWAGILIIVPTAVTGRPYALVTALLIIIALVLLLLPNRKPEGYITDTVPC